MNKRSGAGSADGGGERSARPAKALRGRAGRMKNGRGSGRASSGAVRLWGRHAVEAALKNPDRSHRKLWATREGVESLDGELPSDFPVEWAQPADLARLVARDAPHQGLVLECEPLEDIFLADVLDNDPLRPVVVLDQVTDPHNVGAIMRSAAAFNACCIVTQDRHAPPESGTLAKSASGALEVLPWIRVVNLARALEEIAEAGYWRIGLDGEAETTLGEALPTGPVALVLGAEGDGMRHNIVQHCDAIAKLPISEAMESLNVSNAAAIALYAAAPHRLPETVPMQTTLRRLPFRRTIAALALALLVTACVFAPGKFTSQLDLHKDRSFTFRYTGEILMIPLMKDAKEAVFEPSTCYVEDTLDERECSDEEIATQKTDWEKSREDKQKSEAQATKMLLGGIDPSDPESGKEMAAKLRRQAGWRKVEYIGDGKFDVDFAISGHMDHDFTFPTIEGFPMNNAFVQVFARADGGVRIEAPAFGPQGGGQTMAGMMAGMAASEKDQSPDAATSLADGTFTVVTDGEILANNTDEGPSQTSGGKVLAWKINPRTPAAPTALVRLKP